MNQTELTTAIADHCHLPKATVRQVLDSMGLVVANHLALATRLDREVALPVLGKLKGTVRAARTGRNPQTGAAIEIPERVAVKFKAGTALDNILNPD